MSWQPSQFSVITPQCGAFGCLSTAWQGWKSRLSTAFAGWATVYFVLFGCSRAVTLLKSSVFLCCPFPDSLVRERLLFRLFLLNPVGVCRLLSSLAPSLEYIRPKENPGNSPVLFIYSESSSTMAYYLLSWDGGRAFEKEV